MLYRESYANTLSDPTYLYYLHNAHGDVTQLLNEKGEVIKDYRYDPFGKEQSPESLAFGGKQTTELWRQEIENIDNPFRYCGEYQDEETGNYYLRARYYDPSMQRFINEDSYGVEKGAGWSEHIYGYAGNNPIRFKDPTGHVIFDDILKKPTTYGFAEKDRRAANAKAAREKAAREKAAREKAAREKAAREKAAREKAAREKAAREAAARAAAAKGTGNSLANALNNLNNKYIGGPLNSINKNYGPVAATGAAVTGAFTAAGSMAVAAEAAASGAISAGLASAGEFLNQQAVKAIVNPVLSDRTVQGSMLSVGVQGVQDICNGNISPLDVYAKQALKGAIIGTAQQQLNPKDNPTIIESMIATSPDKENLNTWIGDTWGDIVDTAVGIVH